MRTLKQHKCPTEEWIKNKCTHTEWNIAQS